MQYTTLHNIFSEVQLLCYQDFKDTFVCNTQHFIISSPRYNCCVIRISKILLYAIHNHAEGVAIRGDVVLSGFQRYFCMQYTTFGAVIEDGIVLCYQDFKDTFVCNTQQQHRERSNTCRCVIRISKILLYAIHNAVVDVHGGSQLCYQDFKDTFVCNTQRGGHQKGLSSGCVIRISKILLYAIHNLSLLPPCRLSVVLSGFQRYFCMQYTTVYRDRVHYE